MTQYSVNYKQLARYTGVSYSVILNWRTSRSELINRLVEAQGKQDIIDSLQSDNDRLRSILAEIFDKAKEV